MMVEDIKNSITEKELYTQLTVKVTSEKYKGINEKDIDRNIVNLRLLRYFAWDNIFTECNNYEYILPIEILPYIDIYNKYFKIRYPDRTFKWVFDYGHATIRSVFCSVEYKNTFSLAILDNWKKRKVEKLYALSPLKNKIIPVEIVSSHYVDPKGERVRSWQLSRH